MYFPISRVKARSFSFLSLALLIIATGRTGQAQTPAATEPKDTAIVLTTEGSVEARRFGAEAWNPAQTNQQLRVKDQLRTKLKSRATLRLSNQSVLRVNQLTTLQIEPPTDEAGKSVLDLRSGAAYFFNRESPVETQFRTPQASGAIRGTEFNIEVAENGATVVTLIDGAVDLKNDLGQVSLGSGEQGIVEPGKAPRKTAVVDAINIIQWSLYYPGVIDLADLKLGTDAERDLSASLQAYRAGELLKAISEYPATREPGTDAERVYLAQLNLAAGQVTDTEKLISAIAAGNPGADALRQVIAAVKNQTWSRAGAATTASEFLAESYYQQSKFKLEEARKAARTATEKSPNFGFAWARLAELEFSFARVSDARAALDKGLQQSPRNAQALALQGFLLAARNEITPAIAKFDEAIAIDGALGNAWLGRGLGQIRQGRAEAGRQDLHVAATLEPNRSILRSYLGKAYSNSKDQVRARKELELAKKLDPNDPTSWLYSALLNQQGNQVNDAIRDLEKSKELNDNRGLFRSRMLLDQDRAVRGANLAKMYQDAGMTDVSVREASRAVNFDYANYSAHQFLANSYDVLRDPRQVNLRYDTAWFSELLLANLLAPVGAGSLSQNVSQHEYSKLMESDRLGISSRTEYFSNGAWVNDSSQYGTYKDFGYALDVSYRSDPGFRPNEDLTSLTFNTKFKFQITPQDSVLLQTVYYDFDGGDLLQYHNQAQASQTIRTSEKQEPSLYAGYQHEWSPGNQTLVLVGRVDDTFQLNDQNPSFLEANFGFGGAMTRLTNLSRALPYQSLYETEGYTAELQQIVQRGNHTIIAGGRFQTGDIDTTIDLPARFPTPDNSTSLERISFYAYELWQVLERLQLTAGLSYDRLHYPVNIDTTPVSGGEQTAEKVSPKAGLILNPWKDGYFRFAYSRSLGGVFFDSALRLEPSQIAGFNQAYRSLVAESVPFAGGLTAGTEFETFHAGFDQRFKTGTYLGLEGELLQSDAQRTVGVFLNPPLPNIGNLPIRVGSTRQQIDYEEKSLRLSVNQLLGKEWSLGASYRISQAELSNPLLDIPSAVNTLADTKANVSPYLQQVNLYAIWMLPCGFFTQVDSIWLDQHNEGYANLPGDDFWQHNFYVGYRFPRRRAEIRLGVMNFTDRGYQLNPLNFQNELPRERLFTASFKFNF